MDEFRFPSSSERVSIVGRTGSGKTQAGAWLLSHANYNARPWIVIDFKGDELLNGIEGAKHVDTSDKMPKHAGIYILHAHPDDEDGINKTLMRMWERENIGLFVDEAYMIPKNSPGFMGILTQWRSKKIPSIILSQRPAWISKFVFTEADHFCVFHLNHIGDRKKVGEFLPPEQAISRNAPEFHSHWYDVKRNALFLMRPVEKRDTILERFNSRLKPRRTFFS